MRCGRRDEERGRSPGRCGCEAANVKVSLVPHPTEGHPEGLSPQPLEDGPQLHTGTGRVLLYEDAVHQVSVLLVHLDGGLTHLLEVLVLSERVNTKQELFQMS